jgi:hypothetical protein
MYKTEDITFVDATTTPVVVSDPPPIKPLSEAELEELANANVWGYLNALLFKAYEQNLLFKTGASDFSKVLKAYELNTMYDNATAEALI